MNQTNGQLMLLDQSLPAFLAVHNLARVGAVQYGHLLGGIFACIVFFAQGLQLYNILNISTIQHSKYFHNTTF